MTDSNFSAKKETPPPAAFLSIKRNAAEANEIQGTAINLHASTVETLSAAAKIARVPLLDFVFNSAWMRAREILRQHPTAPLNPPKHPKHPKPPDTRKGQASPGWM